MHAAICCHSAWWPGASVGQPTVCDSMMSFCKNSNRLNWKASCTGGLAVVLFVTAACKNDLDLTERSVTSQGVVGYWATEIRDTQFGTGLDKMCLDKNGTFRLLSQAQGASSQVDGTYSVAGDRIRIKTPTGDCEDRWVVDSQTLRFLEMECGSGDSFRFISSECPADMSKSDPALTVPSSQ